MLPKGFYPPIFFVAHTANSSRPIKEAEVKECTDKGVKNIMEVRFGYDGIEPIGTMRVRWFKDFAKIERTAFRKSHRNIPNIKIVANFTFNHIARKGYPLAITHASPIYARLWRMHFGFKDVPGKPPVEYHGEKYLELMGRAITNFEATPARQERSIEDTSWDTWFSRTVVSQENNLRNTNYSYYDGGQVMGHILDFAIRHDTGNAKSLDDWMRLLYSRYALPKPGFQPDDALKAANEIAGKDESALFSKYIAGKEAIPYEQYFAYAGITVEKKIDDSKGWSGLSFAMAASDTGHAKIQNIIPGGPAEAAGLDFGDEIYALDGRPMGNDDVKKAFDAHKPGDTVKVMVVRLGGLREFTMTFTASPYPTYTLRPMAEMTPEQRAIYNSWMGIK